MKIVSIRAKPYKRGVFERNPLARDYQAIGAFITACSLIEVSLHRAVRAWLNIDEVIARAMIGEPRHGELVEKLKFAFEHQKIVGTSAAVKGILNEICVEAGYINDVRSVVAHKPCWADGVEIEFNNEVTASRQTKLFSYRTSAKQLQACSEWALEIALMIRTLCDPSSCAMGQSIADCKQRIASLDRSKLPSPPRSMNQQTATKRPQRQPSLKSPRKGN